jgi:hypothetical protein
LLGRDAFLLPLGRSSTAVPIVPHISSTG